MSTTSTGGADEVSGILADLWQLMHSVLDESEPALEGLGLSAKAFFALESVGDAPFPAQLSRRLHLPPPTVTYLIKQLEERGFLERRAEPGDLRKFRLVPTPAGLDAVRHGREALGRAFAERLAWLGPFEAAAFGRTVGRLAAARNAGS